MNENEIGEEQHHSSQMVFPMQKRWRNRFHLEVPEGISQDGARTIFYKNEYHVFCPWQRRGKELSSWMHLHTRDFIQYGWPEAVAGPPSDKIGTNVTGPVLLNADTRPLDHGFDFYAQHHICHEGRNILFGWLGVPGQFAEYPSIQQGWRPALTMPRLLMQRSGHIYSEPVQEMRLLRVAASAREMLHENVPEASLCLPETAEVIVDVAPGQAQQMEVDLVYGLESLYMRYDRAGQTMWLSRQAMELGGRGERSFPLTARENFSMRLFVDRTIIEIFLQHGEETASFFIFPKKHILPELVVRADADMERIAVQSWELDTVRHMLR